MRSCVRLESERKRLHKIEEIIQLKFAAILLLQMSVPIAGGAWEVCTRERRFKKEMEELKVIDEYLTCVNIQIKKIKDSYEDEIKKLGYTPQPITPKKAWFNS